MKNLIMITLAASIFIVMMNSCQLFEGMQKEWVPVLEGADFGYLRDVVSKAVEDADRARQNLQVKNYRQAEEKIEHTRKNLLKLHLYYLPMTEVRQLVYDADRLFYLQKKADALGKLEQARKLLMEVKTIGSSGFAASIDEVVVMIDELIFAIKESPQTAGEKFKELGHRVNLMVLKGELIISEEDFE